MKCNVARDLLASYCDGLLEEETKREVEAHLTECEECCKLKESYTAELSAERTILEEKENINPFKKLKRKIKRIKVRAVIAVITASLLVICAGVLTVGEIIKYEEFPSWSGVIQTIEVRSAIHHLMKGDIDGFFEYVYMTEPLEKNFDHVYRPEGISENSLPSVSLDGKEQIENYMKDLLKSSYDKDIKGNYCEESYFTTGYTDDVSGMKYLYSSAIVRVDDLDIEFTFISKGNSKFDTYCEVYPVEDDESDSEISDEVENSYINDFGKACDFLDYVNPGNYMDTMFNGSTRVRLYFEIDRPKEDRYLAEHIVTENSESRRYGSKYSDMCDSLEEKGVSFSTCDSCQIWFDPDGECLAQTMSTMIRYGDSEAVVRFTVALTPERRYIRTDTIEVINGGIPEDIIYDYLEILYYLGD
ncbi:MAG: zf-HC2 domain-containing protein [Ruminococcus albus]|jgi:hypothetical protein|nr:zf-HC2 domain-containing protein [Ruminococcus albus]